MNKHPKSKNFKILKILTKKYYRIKHYRPTKQIFIKTIFRLKELAELKLGDTVQRYKSRFKNDNTTATIRDLLLLLEENRHHIQVMLEPMVVLCKTSQVH